jgi:uncharacterized protein YacL
MIRSSSKVLFLSLVWSFPGKIRFSRQGQHQPLFDYFCLFRPKDPEYTHRSWQFESTLHQRIKDLSQRRSHDRRAHHGCVRRFIFKRRGVMSLEFIFRIIGMIVFALLGGYLGVDLSEIQVLELTAEEGAVIFGLVGALFGLVLTPFLTTRPLRSLRALLSKLETRTLGAGLIGLTVGLVIAALLAFPLSLLPRPLGQILPFVGVLVFAYFGVAVFIMRRNDIFSLFGSRVFTSAGGGDSESGGRTILVDTSVIIDGRIADIAKTGFLAGELLIPRFVLDELQHIADSADGLRRQRGRRGMEILSELQELQVIPVRISDIDVEGTREVDSKLVILARQMNAPILTNDYNLNRVAELQGVAVLNINELANSVKAVLLPGEDVDVKIIQEGKERGQGVGYLSDGTMVVVEDGKDYLDQEITALVTKVLQTAAGRMIFARPEGALE